MKKRITRILLSFTALGMWMTAGYSQAEVSILSAAQFPSIIVDGQSYNLTGYVVNTGTDTVNGNVDIFISVNAGSPILLINNFGFGFIAPGDSVMFQKNNYTFTSAMNTSGLNDILVWPESSYPGVVNGDSALKQALYFEAAAMRVGAEHIASYTGGDQIRYSFDGPLSIEAENVGSGSTESPISFYAQFDKGFPIFLGMTEQTCEKGESAVLNLRRFSVKDMAQRHLPANVYPSSLTFFAVENPEIPSAGSAVFPVTSTPVGTTPDVSTGLKIYPNPVGNALSIEWERANEVSSVQIIDLQGRVLAQSSGFRNQIQTSQLPAGKYILRLSLKDGSQVHKSFVK